MLILPIGDENPQKTVPIVTWGIILLNVAIFVYAATMRSSAALAFYERYWLLPSDPAWHGYITSSFLHANFGHLFFNMLFLWIFADNVEDRFGKLGFIVFYLLGAAAAVAGFLAVRGPLPKPLVGASGAIAAILGAYLVMFPWNRIRILYWFFFFIGVFHIRAKFAIAFWFIIQIIWTYAESKAGAQTGVAYSAHAAGFVFGFAVTMFLRITGIVRPQTPPRSYTYY